MRAFARLLVGMALMALVLPAAGTPVVDDEVLLFFWGDGCPHCASEKEFLAELRSEFPQLAVEEHEVWYDLEGRRVFLEAMAAIGEDARAVPTTIYGGLVWVGFDDRVASEISGEVERRLAPGPIQGTTVEQGTIDLPLLGEVELTNVGLVPATIAIALVDGFNPCSLWALSILLALVLRSGSRKRVLAVGGVFLAVTTLLYGLFIGGLYGALSYAAEAAWIRGAMAGIALAFGLVNLKDYLWFKQGLSLSIPAGAKPKMYARMRDVSDVDRPLPAVLLGTAGLAVGVSLLETPCTAGYPLLWANLVSDSGAGFAAVAALFGVYMLVFLVDELAIFGSAVVAMRSFKLQERGGRILKLISGALMVSLAVTLIVEPDAMTSITGAVWVFGAAMGVAIGLALANAWFGRRFRRSGEEDKVEGDRSQETITH